MTAGVALTSTHLAEAAELIDADVESAGTARAVRPGPTLLVGPISWIPDDGYNHRGALRLEVSSIGWAPAMVQAARDETVPVFVHTHPNMKAYFSAADDKVDATIGTELARITGCGEFLSVVLGGTSAQPLVAARRVHQGLPGPLEMVRVAGPTPSIHLPPGEIAASSIFDRQDRVFGPDGRRILNNLTLGILGAGGTGSPSHALALRLGFGTVISVDDDVVTDSTPTRGHGIGMNDIGQPKVDLMARMNNEIGLETKLIPLQLNVRDPAAEDALAACDVILCCTDGHASRIVLNRIAYYHLIPVIDMGVLISTTEDGELESIDQRVTMIGPGGACLNCHNRISPIHALAEQLDPEERRSRIGEGYLPNIDEPAPAVINYTTMTASYAMTELLHRFFALGDRRHSEIIIQPLTGKIRTNVARPREGCFCADPLMWGQGFTVPRLGLS